MKSLSKKMKLNKFSSGIGNYLKYKRFKDGQSKEFERAMLKILSITEDPNFDKFMKKVKKVKSIYELLGMKNLSKKYKIGE